MNLANIKKGQVYKNYKELCRALCEKVKTGGAKKNHINEIERFINFKRDGNKYIIEGLVESPDIISDNKKRRTEYTKDIERLILDLLVQENNNGVVMLSKTMLYKTLVMINDNYRHCRYRIPKLSAYTDINEVTINEWYTATSNLLQRNLETSLNSLKKQYLVFWNKQYTLCEIIPKGGKYQINKTVYINDYGEESISYSVEGSAEKVYREATVPEIKKILAIERSTLLDFGCETKQDIVRKGKWVDFKNTVDNLIFEELNVAFYYESYRIICNEDHIFDKWQELDKLRLSSIERENTQNQLNHQIRMKIMENARDRQLEAKEEIHNSYGKDCSKPNRATKNYLDDIETITDTLINNNSKKIIQDVIKIKVDE